MGKVVKKMVEYVKKREYNNAKLFREVNFRMSVLKNSLYQN